MSNFLKNNLLIIVLRYSGPFNYDLSQVLTTPVLSVTGPPPPPPLSKHMQALHVSFPTHQILPDLKKFAAARRHMAELGDEAGESNSESCLFFC